MSKYLDFWNANLFCMQVNIGYLVHNKSKILFLFFPLPSSSIVTVLFKLKLLVGFQSLCWRKEIVSDTDLPQYYRAWETLFGVMTFLFVNPLSWKNVYGLVCALMVSLLPYLDSRFSCRDWSECVRQDGGRWEFHTHPTQSSAMPGNSAIHNSKHRARRSFLDARRMIQKDVFIVACSHF